MAVVVSVSLSCHPDATSAELICQDDGWFVWFVRPESRDSDFFTREDVGGDIDAHALHHPGNIERYFESRLKAAGYVDVTRRSSGVGVQGVVVWDFTPTAVP